MSMTEQPDQSGDPTSAQESSNEIPANKPLAPAAQRALAEAAARRVEIDQRLKEGPKEWRGPKGPEPTRYGDWERKGIASDF